jgi:hypothetical protein
MTEPEQDRFLAGAGLCGHCRHAFVNPTRRGTVYLRCTRASWDDRLVRYPRLPVSACPGYDPAAGKSHHSHDN